MSSHISGPWRVGRPTEFGTFACGLVYAVGLEDEAIAQVMGLPTNGMVEELPAHFAPYLKTARLIAAAPELLGQHEANLADLDLLQRAISGGDPVLEIAMRVDDLIRHTREVIAKAAA